MKRLKHELMQTMEMYNTACREAIVAQKRVRSYITSSRSAGFDHMMIVLVVHCNANLKNLISVSRQENFSN